MAVFIKKVDPSQIKKEADLQQLASKYSFAPKVYSVTDSEIHMEDLQQMCIADMYGDDPISLAYDSRRVDLPGG